MVVANRSRLRQAMPLPPSTTPFLPKLALELSSCAPDSISNHRYMWVVFPILVHHNLQAYGRAEDSQKTGTTGKCL
jgi:hypothetical protein